MLKEVFFADKGALGHPGRGAAKMGSRALRSNFKVNFSYSGISQIWGTIILRGGNIVNRYFNQ